MTRLALALALCAAAGAAMAGEPRSCSTDPTVDCSLSWPKSNLERAGAICEKHQHQFPDILPVWDTGWWEPCRQIMVKMSEIQREQEQRDLDFVRGVAGMKEGGR